ncbi:MAG: hypothetical protein GY931_19695 [Maribacter sp.]|nr:hypothetical protein [Maribacter sp.]
MKTNERLFDLDPEVEQTILKSVKDFRGIMTTMESAVGAVVIGQHLGWRGLKMLHNPSTYNKYEKLLGIKFKDICPEETKYSKRLLGIAISKQVGAFWDIVMGRRKVKNKGLVMDEHEAEAIAVEEASKK